MVKRAAIDEQVPEAKSAKHQPEDIAHGADGEEMEYEDMYEDEVEDEIIVNSPEEEDEEMEDTMAYLPGQQMEDDEVLDFDSSAYQLFHALNVEWPCLSFDILGGNASYPLHMSLVTGTQAEKDNQLLVLKMSRLCKMPADDSDEEEEDDMIDEDPILEYRSVSHPGAVNRVRAKDNYVASWSEEGNVCVWDVQELVKSFDPGNRVPKLTPYVVSHQDEGFALDWSNDYSLLSGDNKGTIRLTTRAQEFTTSATLFKGHKSSVEDLQWSPSEKNVFASCSSDKTIKIWDTRMNGKVGLSCQAHETDVNVISWNPNVTHLMASGGDEGSFKVWDLRKIQTPSAAFKWHKGPITSIEWHPSDESVLAVSGADDQITLWDFSVELDKEEQGDTNAPDVPPQLMFIHQGQQEIKEVHWYSNQPGVLVSTAATGFNIFKTISI